MRIAGFAAKGSIGPFFAAVKEYLLPDAVQEVDVGIVMPSTGYIPLVQRLKNTNELVEGWDFRIHRMLAVPTEADGEEDKEEDKEEEEEEEEVEEEEDEEEEGGPMDASGFFTQADVSGQSDSHGGSLDLRMVEGPGHAPGTRVRRVCVYPCVTHFAKVHLPLSNF